MSLAPGVRLGRYQIQSQIGSGGMGEVYLALDSELERTVALKILPAEIASDPERMRRFAQEVKAASALNHPNILVVHDVGRSDSIPFMVTEHVEGDTLRARLRQGRLPLLEALDVAIQTASALSEAHRAGIVHRDIKPENVMVRAGGFVKVVDFGLATTEIREQAIDADAKTETALQTAAGVVLGTYAYMSPEQARGLRVDSRTDLFSLGVMIYEMVAGRAPFAGATSTDVLASILTTHPPPLAKAGSDSSPELDRIVSKALAKDPEERYQSAKDLSIDLKHLKQVIERPVETRRNGRFLFFAAVLLVALVGGIAIMQVVGDRRLSQASSRPKIVPFTTFGGLERSPAFSPDGRQVAYVRTMEGKTFDLWVQLVGAGPPLQLTDTPPREMSPAWSPDGRFLAFLRGTGEDRGLYVIPSMRGVERKLTSIFGWNQRGVTGNAVDWFPDGRSIVIVDKLSADDPWSLFVVSTETGARQRLTTPPPDADDTRVAVSPDGRTLAFARSSEGSADLYRLPVTGGAPTSVPGTSSDLIWGLAWTADGSEIVFSSGAGSDSTFWRIPAAGGQAVPLEFGGGTFDLSISRHGNRLAFSKLVADWDIWELELSPEAGRQPAPRLSPISSTRMDITPQFSPDGKRVAFQSMRSGSSEIWVSDLNGANAVQLTNLGVMTRVTPRWSPDAQSIAFTSKTAGQSEVLVVSAAGGRPTGLTEGIQPSWSKDGQWIYFVSRRTGRNEIWRISVGGGLPVQVTTQGADTPAQFAGEHIYYGKGTERVTVWRKPVNGGTEQQVFEHRPLGSSWVVTEHGIYFIATEAGADSLQGFEFATMSTRQVAWLGEVRSDQIREGLAVSPTERSFLYVFRSRFEYDLMMVENFR